MFGAIAGDVIGSAYEYAGLKNPDFPLFESRTTFTDDTVLTVAVAFALLGNRDYGTALREFGRRYPDRGYGAHFSLWLASSQAGPYKSWGNGSAMRVGPVGFAARTEGEALTEARRSAAVTHNHPEGIKGAQATALAIFLARSGKSKEEIREAIASRFDYGLSKTAEAIRPAYTYDVSCQGSVPESIICFLDSEDWESCVRNAVSLGGDADTMACIAGGIAHAYHGSVPRTIRERIEKLLPDEFLEIIREFEKRFGVGSPPESRADTLRDGSS
jgi:ADP-ribosylglycohydrolase